MPSAPNSKSAWTWPRLPATERCRGFTAPKVLWIERHEPSIFARTRKVLLPKDYLRYRMTGDSASDLSDASGTLFLDVGKRRYSTAMLDAVGLDRAQLPDLAEGSEVTGELRAEVANAWEMKRVPVVGGAGDQAGGRGGRGRGGRGPELRLARHIRSLFRAG